MERIRIYGIIQAIAIRVSFQWVQAALHLDAIFQAIHIAVSDQRECFIFIDLIAITQAVFVRIGHIGSCEVKQFLAIWQAILIIVGF